MEDDVEVTDEDRHMANTITYKLSIYTNNRRLDPAQRRAIRKLMNNLAAEAHIKLALMGLHSEQVGMSASEHSPRWGAAHIKPEGME